MLIEENLLIDNAYAFIGVNSIYTVAMEAQHSKLKTIALKVNH